MGRAIVVAFMLAASIARVGAQDAPERNAVVIETLREARKLLPEGQIGLTTDGFASDSVANAIAIELGMIVGSRNELWKCLREPACDGRALAGMLAVQDARIDGDRAVVTVSTLQSNATARENYGAMYEFTLRRERDARWTVVASKMIYQS